MTISQFKKILGKESKKYSDVELQGLIDQLYVIANIVLETAILDSKLNK